MSNRGGRPSASSSLRPKATLVAAAQAQRSNPAGSQGSTTELSSQTQTTQSTQEPLFLPEDHAPPPDAGPSALPRTLGSLPMTQTHSVHSVGSGSSGSTPTPSVAPGMGMGLGGEGKKLKFKPRMPIRRVKAEPADEKPDISASVPARGSHRGRGRGGQRGRGMVHTSNSVAAGVLGGPRPVTSSSSSRRFTPAPSRYESTPVEVYSDHSDQESHGIIDIDAVSGLGESAPTSLFRDRQSHQKAQGKANNAKDRKDRNRKGKKTVRERRTDVEVSIPEVKTEPVSPEKQLAPLPMPLSDLDIPHTREDDTMLSEDEDQDRDSRGRRVRSFARTGGADEEDVNESQMVDLSESESEEEEEDMEGDFVKVDGFDEPADKLFLFQFPHLFPRFIPPGPIDVTNEDTKDVKDVKPTIAQLRAKRKAAPPPEGRIGTMMITQSGKVKMVLGEDIVMNVTPGVSSTFLQQLVHLDSTSKSAAVLGEVHKQYSVTPDVDRLLQDLFLNGGETPGDKEAERKRMMAEVKLERMVKMELDD